MCSFNPCRKEKGEMVDMGRRREDEVRVIVL
jgi:hypothetical protein